MIKHQCPMCNYAMHSTDHLAGLTITCPECNEKIVVPDTAPPVTEQAPQDPVTVWPTRPPRQASTEELVDWVIKGARPDQAPPGVHYQTQPRRVWPLVVGICAVIFVAVVGLSWLLAGIAAYRVVLVIVAICLGLIGGGILLDILKKLGSSSFYRSDASAFLLLLGWGLYFAVTLGAAFLIDHQFARATVYVDHSSSPEVRLELDGQPWLVIPANANKTMSLRRGKYVVKIYSTSDNKELDRMDIKVEDRGPYILNVLGAQTYSKGTAMYGMSFGFGGGESPPQAVKDKWFKADVDYLFQEPPSTITVSGRGGSASKTYLLRGEPKQPTQPTQPPWGMP